MRLLCATTTISAEPVAVNLGIPFHVDICRFMQVVVFLIVTLRSDVLGHQRHGQPCCPIITVHPEDGCSRALLATSLHGAISQKTVTLIFIVVKTSNLVSVYGSIIYYNVYPSVLTN